MATSIRNILVDSCKEMELTNMGIGYSQRDFGVIQWRRLLRLINEEYGVDLRKKNPKEYISYYGSKNRLILQLVAKTCSYAICRYQLEHILKPYLVQEPIPESGRKDPVFQSDYKIIEANIEDVKSLLNKIYGIDMGSWLPESFESLESVYKKLTSDTSDLNRYLLNADDFQSYIA